MVVWAVIIRCELCDRLVDNFVHVGAVARAWEKCLAGLFYDSSCGNDELKTNMGPNSLELIELSSINKVSLV
jgi:hypothetical protein